MRNKYVIVSEKVDVIEEDFTIAEPYSLICKPIYVYIGHIEKRLFSYAHDPKRPVVPGSSGVVKVIEDPTNKRGDLSGKNIITRPGGRQGIVGLERNGLLATYASVSLENIWGVVNQPRPSHAIAPLVSHALNLADLGEDPSLVLGCDIVGLSIALVLKKYGREPPVVVCENPPKCIKRIGIEAYESINATTRFYSTVYVTDGSFSFIHDTLQAISYRALIVSPYSLINYLPLRREFEARVISTFDDKPLDPSAIRIVSNTLMKIIDYVEVKDLGEVTLLLPPRELGVVVGIKKPKEMHQEAS